ncbi:MAG: hypothetical protein EZS28_051549 [Streblomastix strix]|uniref:Uncharacterized protein n=1 Tax=Streblomastix strix TaxID=222440 RepID=A0A5J4T3K4_9EUKA|nr:MAG: hypothetical protein EZS28_051549 [Streblomastix strix]
MLPSMQRTAVDEFELRIELAEGCKDVIIGSIGRSGEGLIRIMKGGIIIDSSGNVIKYGNSDSNQDSKSNLFIGKREDEKTHRIMDYFGRRSVNLILILIFCVEIT